MTQPPFSTLTVGELKLLRAIVRDEVFGALEAFASKRTDAETTTNALLDNVQNRIIEAAAPAVKESEQ